MNQIKISLLIIFKKYSALKQNNLVHELSPTKSSAFFTPSPPKKDLLKEQKKS